MLEVEVAQQRVLHEVSRLGTERVPFTQALGRVLREEIASPHDVPERDNTAMDGYAVRSSDVGDATLDHPVVLEVIEDLPAGSLAQRRLEPGTAIRIMTGALMPVGADAVVPHELTDGGDRRVAVRQPIGSGGNIRGRGEDMKKDQVVLREGMLLGPAEIGVLASVQRTLVTVARRPVVGILSTGDEIIEVDQHRDEGRVVNSNSYALAAQAAEAGAEPRLLGIVEDTKEATMLRIEQALECDVIVSSGGVSVGAYDFVKVALDELGAETHFWQVAMKPGRPLVFARLRDRLVFGLPGNPVSCMVAFVLFIAPALRKAMGMTGGLLPPTVLVRLETTVRSRGDRRFYQRARVISRDGLLVARPMPVQGSGVSTSMVEANAFVIVERETRSVEAGEIVPAVLFGAVQSE